jgi:hypothetical protein
MRWCATKKYILANMVCIIFLYIVTDSAYATEDIPSSTMVLENTACIQCHEKESRQLVEDWRSSAHATSDPVVGCIDCHGRLHKETSSHARRDESCIDCHGGEKGPVVHSYSSSKHGTLMRIEKNGYDWNLPFELANYRAPGCGYCHMRQSNHNVSATVRHDLMSDLETEEVQDGTRAVCQDCHSPRYITHLFSNGEAMLEIARMKVREANKLIETAAAEFTKTELEPVRELMKKMRQHLRNVFLGVGHHSPDYQWWHGHPALDGDLLRIKGNIAELRRTH